LKNNFAKYLLAIYSVVASFMFGLLMDLQLWPWLISSQSQLAFSIDATSLDNFRNFLIFHFSTSLAWDIPRAVLTAALIIVAGDILISALQRTINRLQLA
jgi:energy-coupling factor transport system substrate-specific component